MADDAIMYLCSKLSSWVSITTHDRRKHSDRVKGYVAVLCDRWLFVVVRGVCSRVICRS